MPSRNITRHDTPESYYHVYARGASKQSIFLDESDFNHFLGLFNRYLSHKQFSSSTGVIYPNYSEGIELLAYCLMGNHFHLLIYQIEQGALSKFMKSLMTSYSRYFNLKHNRSGSLFENRYKASIIINDTYLQHISRYIHLNPRSWRRYPYSSITYYAKGNEPEWLHTKRVLDMHTDRPEYVAFVADYEAQQEILDDLKHELADR